MGNHFKGSGEALREGLAAAAQVRYDEINQKITLAQATLEDALNLPAYGTLRQAANDASRVTLALRVLSGAAIDSQTITITTDTDK